jgi:hypothetical protein
MTTLPIFPNVPMGEVTAFPFRAPYGLFGFRLAEAAKLLQIPLPIHGAQSSDNPIQSRDLFLGLCRPITSLSLFVSVVALEDFARDVHAELYVEEVEREKIRKCRAPLIVHLQRLAEKCDGLAFMPDESDRLDDLVKLRNIIAHYGGLVPPDRKFLYWKVDASHPLNPPASFVQGEIRFIADMATRVHEAVRDEVFRRHISAAGAGWSGAPSDEILRLIEVFAFFGKLTPGAASTMAYAGPDIRTLLAHDFSDLVSRADTEREAAVASLQEACIRRLVEKFGP